MNERRTRAGDDAMSELVDVIGVDAARRLARVFGGTGLYLPRVAGDHHPIVVSIGREAADRLVAWGAGSTLAVPKQAERRERVSQLRRQGALTIAQIARETDFSERHVYRLLHDQAADDQPGLF